MKQNQTSASHWSHYYKQGSQSGVAVDQRRIVSTGRCERGLDHRGGDANSERRVSIQGLTSARWGDAKLSDGATTDDEITFGVSVVQQN